jgi:hypothetical protein
VGAEPQKNFAYTMGKAAVEFGAKIIKNILNQIRIHGC